jgi:hypothetical protein
MADKGETRWNEARNDVADLDIERRRFSGRRGTVSSINMNKNLDAK